MSSLQPPNTAAHRIFEQLAPFFHHDPIFHAFYVMLIKQDLDFSYRSEENTDRILLDFIHMIMKQNRYLNDQVTRFIQRGFMPSVIIAKDPESFEALKKKWEAGEI